MRLWDVSNGRCLCTETHPGGQYVALDLVSRETGGAAGAAAWKVPGRKSRFQRLLCAASIEVLPMKLCAATTRPRPFSCNRFMSTTDDFVLK